MPKVRTRMLRSASLAGVEGSAEPASCARRYEGCGCHRMPEWKLRSVRREVGRILAGKTPLPEWVRVQWHHPSCQVRCRQIHASSPCQYRQPYQRALADRLSKNNISRDQYHAWQQRYQHVALKPDKLLCSLAEPQLSERALELQREFSEQGAHNFSCKEFRTVIENIRAIIHFEYQQSEAFAHQELAEFIQQLDDFLAHSEALPYWQVHGFCLHFIMFMNEYEAGLDKQASQPQRAQALARVNKMKHVAWINPTMPESQKLLCDFLDVSYKRCHGVDFFAGELPTVSKFCCELMDRLLWPSFEELSTTFFTGCARYDIAPVGVLLSRRAFHDNLLMTRMYFHYHDLFHASHLPRSIIGEDPLARQQVFSTRRHLLKQISADDAVLNSAINLVFIRDHESIIEHGSSHVPQRKSILDTRSSFAEEAEWYAEKLHHFDALPNHLSSRHIYAAMIALRRIGPYLKPPVVQRSAARH